MIKKIYFFIFLLAFVIMSNNVKANTYCEDEDSGKNISEYAKVKNDSYSRYDQCYDIRPDYSVDYCWGDYCSLKEYFCTEDYEIDSELFNCPDGCEEGVCLNTPITEEEDYCLDYDNDGYCAKFITPGKGEVFKAGETIEIKWVQSGVDSVRISASYGATTKTVFNESVDINKSNHSASWVVPEMYIGKDKIYFTMQYYKTGEGSEMIYSEYFSVEDPATQEEIDKRPIISNLELKYNQKSSTAYVTWETDKPASSNITFKQLQVYDVYEVFRAGDYGYRTKHSVKIPGITPAIVFTYKAVSIDQDGNESKSSEKRFAYGDRNSYVLISDDKNTSKIESVVSEIIIKDTSKYSRLKGKIMLKVEDSGKAYYVNPKSKTMHYLGRPDDAFSVMREQGVGISEKDFNSFGEYAPSKLAGYILLRVEANGEAYYVNPVDLKMYYLGRPADAFNIMRNLGLGISNSDFNNL